MLHAGAPLLLATLQTQAKMAAPTDTIPALGHQDNRELNHRGHFLLVRIISEPYRITGNRAPASPIFLPYLDCVRRPWLWGDLTALGGSDTLSGHTSPGSMAPCCCSGLVNQGAQVRGWLPLRVRRTLLPCPALWASRESDHMQRSVPKCGSLV